MEIGLFFGSFNPIHIGHLIIASLVHQTTSVKEIWFIVSPQNPLKQKSNLLHEFDRYDLVQAAVADNYHFRVSDIEFNLPRPSYTINTLTYLSEKHPDKQFKLIIGEDNLTQFPKWKNHLQILENYGLIVYPRPCATKTNLQNHPKITLIDAPMMDISATMIRKLVKTGKSIQYLVPDSVIDLINGKKLYS